MSTIPLRSALVLGAGGFIGSHLVVRLKREGYFVRGVDLKQPEFSWERDGEALLQRLKPRFYEQPPLPSIIPLSRAMARTLPP